MSKNPILFDIQRGSYVDGPGLRTAVFFKGCNLDCAWCHNPESKRGDTQLLFYRKSCVGCGRCAAVCPNRAVRVDFSVDRKTCTACGACAEVCPAGAKTLCGGSRGIDEIMDIIGRDVRFYRASGGGVTFSGGECMLQIDALCELLERCAAAGIHTAVDTAGNLPWDSFARVLPATDLFLYDLKHTDTNRHRAGTGVGNERILDNLERLLGLCPEKVILRVPVIPGFNADDESLAAIGAWIAAHPAPRAVEPLCYHRLGQSKSEALGLAPFDAAAPDKEEFARMKALLLGARA